MKPAGRHGLWGKLINFASVMIVMKRYMLAAAAGLSLLAAVAAEPPAMGWSSWNTYRVNISDSIICRQADAMVAKGLAAAGYRYVNIDDGFFGGRGADGVLKVHPERFPSGLKPVVDHIHSLGLKAGIYSDAGCNTCGNFWDADSLGVGVGLYGHDDDDARFYFVDNGFDFIKVDFCGGDAAQNSGGLALDEHERYAAIRRAIDSTGRDDVRVNVCRWAFPGAWVRSVGSSWRIAADITPRWESIKRIIAANSCLSAYAGDGHYNDMDMLEIGRGLSEAEERTHFGMWCVMSSPLLIGCDLTSIPERSLRLLMNLELIAVNQDALGLQAQPVKRSDAGAALYVKDFGELHGPVRVAAVCNLGDSVAEMSVGMVELGLQGRVEVRDLMARRDLPAVTDGAMTLRVGPHDTVVLKLTAERRLEPTVYEAETAWLERYQQLGISPAEGHAVFVDDPECSGGAKVAWLGNHADNWMEWRDVWSRSGGEYDVEVRFAGGQTGEVALSVNGGRPQPVGHKVRVGLASGSNRIRLAALGVTAPEIDCIVLTRVR